MVVASYDVTSVPIVDLTWIVTQRYVCSDCGLPVLGGLLNGGILQASDGPPTIGGGIYNLSIDANTPPSFFIKTRLLPPPHTPIYCAVPDGAGSKTGYLHFMELRSSSTRVTNLIPTFAPTDRKDVFWKVDPKNATYPQGDWATLD
ncbi:hypothetical protein FS842_003731 [Serendipita sp. 407]|nr:hypothetical protein FS842_003731 [Serendipita sp. 407]